MVPEGVISKDLQEDVQQKMLLVCGALVFFIQIGLTMASAGASREKHAGVIAAKHLLTVSAGAIGFYIFGFGIAYGDGNRFMGYRHLALEEEHTFNYSRWFFEFANAVLATSIASNAVIEHGKFETRIIGAFMLCSWVYPVTAHWIWSKDGWLSMHLDKEDMYYDTGALDFSGAGALHVFGGFSGLAALWILGPRRGRFTENGQTLEIPGNNAAVVLIGLLMTWFGWYGLSTGRALGFIGSTTSGGFNASFTSLNASVRIASVCAVANTLAAVSGGITASVLGLISFSKRGHGVWDIISFANGVLAGLVSISASCAVVNPWAAIVIGVIGACIYFAAAQYVPRFFKVDDQLETVSIHGFCGLWALLASAAFAREDLVTLAYGKYGDHKLSTRPYGFIFGGDSHLLVVALNCIIAIGLWVLVNSILFYFLARMIGIHRVDAEEESEGCETKSKLITKMREQELGEIRSEIVALRAAIITLKNRRS